MFLWDDVDLACCVCIQFASAIAIRGPKQKKAGSCEAGFPFKLQPL
jgi:hypothetical protein